MKSNISEWLWPRAKVRNGSKADICRSLLVYTCVIGRRSRSEKWSPISSLTAGALWKRHREPRGPSLRPHKTDIGVWPQSSPNAPKSAQALFQKLTRAADDASTEALEDALENKSDASREEGEENADAIPSGADADGNSAKLALSRLARGR
jgi:hypothetical protein